MDPVNCLLCCIDVETVQCLLQFVDIRLSAAPRRMCCMVMNAKTCVCVWSGVALWDSEHRPSVVVSYRVHGCTHDLGSEVL